MKSFSKHINSCKVPKQQYFNVPIIHLKLSITEVARCCYHWISVVHLALPNMKRLQQLIHTVGLGKILSGGFVLFKKPCSICTNRVYFLPTATSAVRCSLRIRHEVRPHEVRPNHTTPLGRIVQGHALTYHLYANDTRLYLASIHLSI